MTSNSSFRAMLLALVLTLTGCLHDTPSEENFWGVELPGEAAADFTLVDQYGNNFSFNETTGKIVVMTFIYTSCPDICPQVTYQLGKLQEALGADYGERVEILSVTVDPSRDTVEHLAHWTTMKNASWPHLTSSAGMPEMAMNNSVWAPYDIYVEKVGAEEHEHDENGDNETGDNGGNETEEHEHDENGDNETGDNGDNETDDEGDDDYGVNHSTILYIIDQQGRLRVAWPGLDWTYRDLHHDVALMLGSG